MIWTGFLQQLKHILNIPVCCAFVSCCLAVLRTMEIPPLLYGLPIVFFSLYFPPLASLVGPRYVA
jgi:hypothetical protein